MKRIIYSILNFLEKNTMKKNIIIFTSFPDYSDNSYALFKYMMGEKYYEKYQLVWLLSKEKESIIEEKIFKEFGISIKCYKKNSLRGMIEYLSAKKAFCSHGIFSFIHSNNNKKINLWHGMPLKNIGFLDKESKGVTTCNLTIATSDKFKELVAKSFNLKEEQILLTGQPRNDLLFEKTGFFEKMEMKKEDFLKTVIWLPTFRKSIIGDIREDGFFQDNKLGIIQMEKLKDLNKFLTEKKYLMIIKIHPMDILQKLQFEKFSNLIILKSNDLEEINEQLYPLLGSSDLLITDYSSVWIDYEILGKPIYFAMDDFEEYKNNRGVTLENLADKLPGDIIKDYEVLLEKLENIPKEIQKNTGTEFNLYKDNKSCERIVKALNL